MQHRKYISLDISIVIYETNKDVLSNCLIHLAESIALAKSKLLGLDSRLHFIINDEIISEEQLQVYKAFLNEYCPNIKHVIHHGHGNLGYGCGHNLAITSTKSDIFLVLNPDVFMEKEAIYNGITFLRRHKDVGLVSPLVVNDHNIIQYLCRRYPTIIVLSLRLFIPNTMLPKFRKMLDDYEMRDIINKDDTVYTIPIVSGCFMLFDTSILKEIGGFSEEYFMYFEDYDLSLRMDEISQISYYPKINIIHLGGGASKKGIKHIKMFVTSAFRFFNRHGWRLY